MTVNVLNLEYNVVIKAVVDIFIMEDNIGSIIPESSHCRLHFAVTLIQRW